MSRGLPSSNCHISRPPHRPRCDRPGRLAWVGCRHTRSRCSGGNQDLGNWPAQVGQDVDRPVATSAARPQQGIRPSALQFEGSPGRRRPWCTRSAWAAVISGPSARRRTTTTASDKRRSGSARKFLAAGSVAGCDLAHHAPLRWRAVRTGCGSRADSRRRSRSQNRHGRPSPKPSFVRRVSMPRAPPDTPPPRARNASPKRCAR